MELQDYIRILRRRGWIIILLMVMTATAAFAFSKLQTPIYRSSVEILVQPARADWGITQSAKILLRSYASWMFTNTRAQDVIDLLHLDRVPADLLGDVQVASDESRLIIQMTVEDPDGDLANDIAQAWTDIFIQWRNAENAKQRKEDRVEAFQLDPPRFALAGPKWKINVVAGLVLGTLVGAVITFALEWIESGVVRRPDDIDRYLGLPLLGAIPAPKLDASRPYALGNTHTASEPSLAPAAPGPVPTPSPQADAPTPPPSGEEEIGPIEPTILLSKGD
jgi:capsular polysaccharide biosynthesis protein